MEITIEKLLDSLVSINSIFPNEKRLSEYLFKYFDKLGYLTYKQKVTDQRFNLVVEKGTGSRGIILYSHLDTIGVVDGWKTDPFKLYLNGDKAFGLGVWDMKAGMVVNIIAFLKAEPKNFKLKLVFGVDEENISRGAFKLAKSSFLSDIDCLISTEPAFCFGLRGIVKARAGRAVYRVIFSGESRHSAFYKKEYDINLAVSKLLYLLSDLSNNSQFIFARKIQSQSIGLSLPQSTIIELDSTTVFPTSHNEVLHKIKNIILKLQKEMSGIIIKIDFKKRETPYLESYEIDDNNKFLNFLSQSVFSIIKKRAQPYSRRSVSDENVFYSKKVTVLGIGPDGGNAHAPNEWVSISSINKLIDILSNFLNLLS